MNRVQRRQAEKDARRGITREVKSLPLPALLDEFAVFEFIEATLNKIKHSALDSIKGVPVFKDEHGEWCQIAPALDGWILAWQDIIDRQSLNIDLQPLQIISKRLAAGVVITHANVDKAFETLAQCRAVFKSTKRKDITKSAQTSLIKLYLEAA